MTLRAGLFFSGASCAPTVSLNPSRLFSEALYERVNLIASLPHNPEPISLTDAALLVSQHCWTKGRYLVRFKTPVQSFDPSLIFHEYALEISSSDRLLREIYNGPWLITRVCKLWMSIIKSTPCLWSRISINMRGHQFSTSLSQIVRVAIVLEKGLRLSKSTSLYVSISNLCEVSLVLLEILVRHCEKWSSFSLYWAETQGSVTRNRELMDVLELVKGRVRRLDALDLQSDRSLDIGDVFADTPSVKSCSIHRQIIMTIPTWPQLRSVGFDSTSRILEIIQRRPELTTVCERYGIMEMSVLHNAVALKHSNIKVLTAHSSELLQSLTLPALQELHVDSAPSNLYPGLPCHRSSFTEVISSFILRSRCHWTLSVLSLKDMTLDETTLLLLQNTPSVMDLRVSTWKIPPSFSKSVFFSLLLKALEEDLILPRLERLSLDLTGSGEAGSLAFTKGLVSKLATLRVQTKKSSRLSSVHIHGVHQSHLIAQDIEQSDRFIIRLHSRTSSDILI
ncbi:hypothetical protein C8J56DRAFT_902570 [Mycena floridula]|nr:hypothetical protein C8J56DRAFT_902570 [Mycena floridula]